MGSGLDEHVDAEADLDMGTGTDIVPMLRAKRHLALIMYKRTLLF